MGIKHACDSTDSPSVKSTSCHYLHEEPQAYVDWLCLYEQGLKEGSNSQRSIWSWFRGGGRWVQCPVRGQGGCTLHLPGHVLTR